MHINFIRNIQFTKLLKVDGRLREFNFRKLTGLNEGLITVDVSDDRGNRIMFTMQKNGSEYTFYNQPYLPDWVAKNEQNLSEMIDAELRAIG
ncbi:MAG TPA: hypothetical protein VK166_12205 [Chitinophagaceae bacterium]|jgi:hypothetical protein|nr:hypothetical protein [Chitinophagaceae bacterium]